MPDPGKVRRLELPLRGSCDFQPTQRDLSYFSFYDLRFGYPLL